MNPGTFYAVGVGPGDPELLTLKAVRVLQGVSVVAAPVAREDGDSFALSVVASHLRPEQRILRIWIPMAACTGGRDQHRRVAAASVAAHLADGRDVAFLTEGDPLLYSTAANLLTDLARDYPVRIVPGVTSACAAAAEAGVSLVTAGERLAVVPAAHESRIGLKKTLSDFDCVVLLKVNNVLDGLIDTLDELDLLDRTVLVERTSQPNVRIERNLRTLKGESLHYFSLMIVKKGAASHDPSR